MSDPAPYLLHLQGDHYRMGYQHGQQVAALRPAIVEAVETRLDQLERLKPGPAFAELVRQSGQLLHRRDPAIISFMRGQADALELDFEWLLHYNLVNFLWAALPQGCTAWAAAGQATADGRPLLVKNRDYRPEHLPLQAVVWAEPGAGYRCLYVTSAGNPGVFVAGLNRAGLAVADTHAPCPDIGPGLPTYALLMHLLEEHRSTASALAYLQAETRLGRNNIILADAAGQVAVFENAHSQSAVIEAESGFVVATNHFNSPALRECYLNTEPPGLQGNTYRRYQKVVEALQAAQGRIDPAMATRLMASHEGPLASLCRHLGPDSTSSTISSLIMLPQQGELHFCHGQPCQNSYQVFAL